MDTNEIFAVIDLGSHTTVGMIARKLEDGTVSPISYHSEPSNSAIRYGCVYNIDDTAQIIRNIIERLNNDLPDNFVIKSLYIGLGGQSTRSRTISLSHTMENPDGEEIKEHHLEKIMEKLRQVSFDGQEILDVTKPFYDVDGKREKHPRSILCKEFTTHFQLITVRSSLLRNIRVVVEERLKLRLAGVLINPISEAEVTLSNDEKVLGAAYVNIGASCTSVAIYKNDSLRFLRVLPMGSKNITQDICSLHLMPSDAEAIKVKHASAQVEADSDAIIKVNSGNGFSERTLKLIDVNRLVAARAKEIVDNVAHIIDTFERKETLGAGVVFSGGGKNLRGFKEILEERFPSMRIGRIRSDKAEQNAISDLEELLTCIGLASNAEEQCIGLLHSSIDELFSESGLSDSQNKEEQKERQKETIVSQTNNEPKQQRVEDDLFSGAHDQNRIEIQHNTEPKPEPKIDKSPQKHRQKKGLFKKASEYINSLLTEDIDND